MLQSHLEDQAGLLVGKSVLDFVHPDERATAEQDLGSVLESKLLHGSVTRYIISQAPIMLLTLMVIVGLCLSFI